MANMENCSFRDTISGLRKLKSDDYVLKVRQQPESARVTGTSKKCQKPIHPPPIIQLSIRVQCDPQQNHLQNPHYFICASLHSPSELPDICSVSSPSYDRDLLGTTVSSMHKLKDIDDTYGGFFVFSDLSVKIQGQFILCFSVFEMINNKAQYIKTIKSQTFTVYPMKDFPGTLKSTTLSRLFKDQGVRLGLQRDPRTFLKSPTSAPSLTACVQIRQKQPYSLGSQSSPNGNTTCYSFRGQCDSCDHDGRERKLLKTDGWPQISPYGKAPYNKRLVCKKYHMESATYPLCRSAIYPRFPQVSCQEQSHGTSGNVSPAVLYSAFTSQGHGHYLPQQKRPNFDFTMPQQPSNYKVPGQRSLSKEGISPHSRLLSMASHNTNTSSKNSTSVTFRPLSSYESGYCLPPLQLALASSKQQS